MPFVNNIVSISAVYEYEEYRCHSYVGRDDLFYTHFHSVSLLNRSFLHNKNLRAMLFVEKR